MSKTSQRSRSKTLVITGGGSGIGFEIARRWIEGARSSNGDQKRRVFLIGKDAPVLEAASQKLGIDSVKTATCDLREERSITAVCERVLNESEEVYGLVNNAGVYPFGQLQNTSLKDWNDTLSINLTAAFLMTQRLASAMSKLKQGRIINISSTAGILPNHFALAYSVSKAALIQLTKTLAKELGKDQITVNCICPGIVRSPMHEGYHANDVELERFYAKKGAQFPLGRIGEASDVSNAAEFLLREESNWVTGEVMVVDGGRLLL